MYVLLPIICGMTLLYNSEQVIYAVYCLRPIGFYSWIKQLSLYSCGLLLLVKHFTMCQSQLYLFILFQTCSFSDRIYFIPILIGMAVWAWRNKRDFTYIDKVLWGVTCIIFCVFCVLPSVTSLELLTQYGIEMVVLPQLTFFVVVVGLVLQYGSL